MTYLVFIAKPSGYELHEHEGDPPPTGAEVEEDGRRYWVSKLAASPLPGDERPCAYLQA